MFWAQCLEFQHESNSKKTAAGHIKFYTNEISLLLHAIFFFYIRTTKFWAEAGCSYKYFEDFASNVFKMSLTIEVSIGCAVVIFHSHKPTGSINSLLVICYLVQQERNVINRSV